MDEGGGTKRGVGQGLQITGQANVTGPSRPRTGQSVSHFGRSEYVFIMMYPDLYDPAHEIMVFIT